MAEYGGGVVQRHRFSNSNDDVIVEILSWLPVKSLLRLRCVCKSWCALLSNSHFVLKHLSQEVGSGINSNRSASRFLLFRLPSRFPQCIDYHSLKNPHAHAATRELVGFPYDLNESSIVGSCNGLICLLGNHEGCYGSSRILLWNPSTRQTRELPDLDYFRFAPLFYGFGFDPTTEDYKVILGGTNTQVAIFALKSRSWKIVRDLPYVELLGQGYFLNGSLHWVELGKTGSRIRSFDFADEKLHSLSFFGHEDCYEVGMGTMGDRLYFYTHKDIINNQNIDDAITIWVMKEYGVDQSWTKLAKIRSGIIPPEVRWLKLISILEDGEVLMKSSKNDLVLYNPKDETCRIVPGIPGIEVAMYVETLVSPVTGNASTI